MSTTTTAADASATKATMATHPRVVVGIAARTSANSRGITRPCYGALAMKPSAHFATLAAGLALLVTTGCPADKETDTTDSGAAETTGRQGPVVPDPQTAEPGPEKAETEPAKPAKLAPMERGLDSAAK